MTELKYGTVKKTNLGFDQAVEAVTAALAEEGFGILTTIDAQAVVKNKLNIDRPKYLILGACNPNLAHVVLDAEPWAGLLLPCNVVIQEIDGGTEVGFMEPEVVHQLSNNSAIYAVACDARDRLHRVAEGLPGR
ncbi:MAG: DUF302 domain-containing protein [Dehalococcoidia bacterium]|jgi:uncharacterized protein (DUF302 family)|nr:DUF302 domain-containing protein [Dehalococcoidia bacterium]